MLVNEPMAKHRVHLGAGVGHGAFQVELLGHGLFATAVQNFYPALGVIQRFVHIGRTFHGLAAPGHDGRGLQGTQGLQGGRPLFQLGVTGVDAGLVFHQVATEQDLF